MSRATTAERLAWLALAATAIALRWPAWVEPTGSDQSLYMYVADRIRDGGMPYLDAWDQKPPGVFLVYAVLRGLWPTAAVVTIGDTLAAVAAAAGLWALTRRSANESWAWGAAIALLVFGHPAIQRLSGLYVRGQCEVYIAAAITTMGWLVWRPRVTNAHALLAGVAFAAAVWLKYNAATYGLPLAFALAVTPAGHWRRARDISRFAALASVGAGAVTLAMIGWLQSGGAIDAWWRATIDYNLAYSGETYRSGAIGVLRYVLMIPIHRMRADMLWYLGGVGLLALALGGARRVPAASGLAALWLAASVLSIAANGARDLPQYFIQAAPALAFAFAIGSASTRSAPALRYAMAVLVVVGLWRVGTDPTTVAGLRWGGVPEAIANVKTDLAFMRGALSRDTFLARFKGAQKYDALESDTLASWVRETTTPSDSIYVFGFAPGVYLEAQRLSASRFFWSRPVVLEFAKEAPGYGSNGLAADLAARAPAVIALQKKDWGPGEPNSEAFFLGHPTLATWLRDRYTLERDTAFFSVWRRTTS